jgi:hypothetical protein
MKPALALAVLALLAVPATAADRIGLRPGMSPDQAGAAIQGRCPTSYAPPPYLTCVDDRFVITATFTKKGRLNWLRLIEPTKEEPKAYAEALAAELGFTGPGSPCEVYDAKTFCFTGEDGSVLGAGSTEYEGAGFEGTLTSYLFNDRLVSADGGIQ